MEFDLSNTPNNEETSESENINIRFLIDKYLKYWKWFLLSFTIAISVVYYKMNFIRPQFRATTTIKIKDEKGGDKSTLSVFQDLGILNGSKDNIEDEIEILKSKSLIAEVIKSLNLNVRYFTDKNPLSNFLDNNLGLHTEFYQTESYVYQPLKINFFLDDTTLYKAKSDFIIFINSSNNYTYRYTDKDQFIEKKYAFGEKINTSIGEIVITPNINLKENNFIGSNIHVNIASIKDLANSYSKNIQIEAKSEYSNVLSLSIIDGNKTKAEDFLNELVNKYNERAIGLIDELTKNTSDFVNRRLEIISSELTNVDLTAETIKTRYQISDVASETGLTMESGQRVENQIVQTNMELEKINYIK